LKTKESTDKIVSPDNVNVQIYSISHLYLSDLFAFHRTPWATWCRQLHFIHEESEALKAKCLAECSRHSSQTLNSNPQEQVLEPSLNCYTKVNS
jgi:hypothetical protein